MTIEYDNNNCSNRYTVYDLNSGTTATAAAKVALYDAVNYGGGVGVLSGTSGNTLIFKTLLAGDNITLEEINNTIVINASSGGTSGGSTGSGNQYYTGTTENSVANTSVGGITSGTILTGKTFTELFQSLLITYLSPTLTNLSITGQDTSLEVGEDLSGSKVFTWSSTNSANISGNTISINDLTADSVLVSTTNDGSQSIDIGTVTNTAPISQQYRAEGINTNGIEFNSNTYTITSMYPYFYGTFSSEGATAGSNRPSASDLDLSSATKVVSSSNGTITIDFNSAVDDYIWFAIPSTSTSKTVWYVNELNSGNISGSISVGGNLFPTSETLEIDSPTGLWSNIDYDFYISNYQTTVSDNMQMRNS